MSTRTQALADPYVAFQRDGLIRLSAALAMHLGDPLEVFVSLVDWETLRVDTASHLNARRLAATASGPDPNFWLRVRIKALLADSDLRVVKAGRATDLAFAPGRVIVPLAPWVE